MAENTTAPVRAVNEAVVRAIEATVEAVQHYKSRDGSLAGFFEGITHGISYEMTNAILGMASDASEADITIEWDPTTPAVGFETQFTFNPSDITPLAKAAAKLAEDESARPVTMMGRVHLLAKKQAGSPGVFGIDSLQPEGPRKVRVRLADEEDYHEAVRAHEEDLALMVSGRLEKEGNLSWLYDATVIRTLGHIGDYMPKRGRARTLSGQTDLLAEE
ncbi:hypothetical protein ACFWYW_15685 [Nonomuraea sp. NPDC059023]|uniref:hypothetical protein n=1 Tax=unclassified Nonomuraea TaxID=2593643 RepID=UPI0036CDE387